MVALFEAIRWALKGRLVNWLYLTSGELAVFGAVELGKIVVYLP